MKRLLIVLSDEDYNEVKKVKDRLKIPWDRFIKLAARVLDKLPEEELKKHLSGLAA